jgi:hypothetical protein
VVAKRRQVRRDACGKRDGRGDAKWMRVGGGETEQRGGSPRSRAPGKQTLASTSARRLKRGKASSGTLHMSLEQSMIFEWHALGYFRAFASSRARIGLGPRGNQKADYERDLMQKCGKQFLAA